MKENKNIELEQTQTNEEVNVTDETLESTSNGGKVEIEEIDSDFADIDKDTMKKNYIIIGILYLFVVILSILLVIGIKNQKDIVKDKIDSDEELNDKVEEEKNDENVIPEEIPEEEKNDENVIPEEIPKEEKNDENINSNINNNDELDDEFNILNQI